MLKRNLENLPVVLVTLPSLNSTWYIWSGFNQLSGLNSMVRGSSQKAFPFTDGEISNRSSLTASPTACVVLASAASLILIADVLEMVPVVYASMYLLKAGSTSIHLSFLLHEKRLTVTRRHSNALKKVTLNFLLRGSRSCSIKFVVGC